MPFKSEEQRRYLWANEPEIARDWTDTYGSRIHKNNGGIMSMQGGVKNYLGEQPMVNAPKYWQSAPDHEMTELAYITPQERDALVDMDMYGTMNGSPNEGPSGLMSLNGWGDKEQGFGMSDRGRGITGTGGHSFGDQETRSLRSPDSPSSDPGYTTTSPKDTFEQSWTGQPGFLGFGGGYKNLNVPGDTSQGHQSRFGIGNLFRGAASMFGGIPGRVGSMLSHIDPRQLRGKNPDGGWNTQRQYEDARNLRRDEKRMANMLSRRDRDLDYGEQNLYNLSEGKYDFRDDQFGENQAGITGTDVAQEFDVKDLITKVGGTVDNNAMDAYWKKALGDIQYQEAKVTKQDLAKYLPINQKDLIDRTNYEDALEYGLINKDMTKFEYEKMREGKITEAGTYTEKDFA